MDEKITRYSLLFIALVALTVSLIYLKPVLVPFVISVFIYFIVIPVLGLFRDRLHLPHMPGLFLTIFIIICIAGGLIVTAAASFESVLNDTKIYQEKLGDLASKLSIYLGTLGIDMSEEMRNLQTRIRELPIFTMIRSMTREFFAIFGQAFLAIIYLMFLVAGHNPEKKKSLVRSEIESGVQKYIITKVVSSAVTGILVGIILKAIGLDMAFMFAVVTFLLNFIPSIGSLFAIILPLPVAFIQFDLSLSFYMVLVLPALIQFALGNVLEPKVMGEGLGLHPVTILLSLMFWGMIWGTIGMLLAVPMTVCIKIIGEQFSTTRPLVKMMSG